MVGLLDGPCLHQEPFATGFFPGSFPVAESVDKGSLTFYGNLSTGKERRIGNRFEGCVGDVCAATTPRRPFRHRVPRLHQNRTDASLTSTEATIRLGLSVCQVQGNLAGSSLAYRVARNSHQPPPCINSTTTRFLLQPPIYVSTTAGHNQLSCLIYLPVFQKTATVHGRTPISCQFRCTRRRSAQRRMTCHHLTLTKTANHRLPRRG